MRSAVRTTRHRLRDLGVLMRIQSLHPWDLDEADARTCQRQLARSVRLESDRAPVRYIVGLDVAYAKDDERLVGGAVVVDADTLGVVEEATIVRRPSYPYIPGLFSFREAPVLLDTLVELSVEPDLILCDGHGYAHPNRFGLACHIGLLCDKPAIGCAKTLLVGAHDGLDQFRGAKAPLTEGGETIGYVVRTRHDVKPVYVSPGHRQSFESAVDRVLTLSPRYRVPEPLRLSDQLVNRTLKRLHTEI